MSADSLRNKETKKKKAKKNRQRNKARQEKDRNRLWEEKSPFSKVGHTIKYFFCTGPNIHIKCIGTEG